MVETSVLLLSLICVGLGAAFVLFPRAMLAASRAMNRTLAAVDESLMRYRYLIGLLFFAVSYGLFRLALLMPLSR